MASDKARFVSELRVYCVKIEYNFVARDGRLFMPVHSHCDMAACVRFFRRIDREVSLINTFAGSTEDTRYVRHNDGKRWTAIVRGQPGEWAEV